MWPLFMFIYTIFDLLVMIFFFFFSHAFFNFLLFNRSWYKYGHSYIISHYCIIVCWILIFFNKVCFGGHFISFKFWFIFLFLNEVGLQKWILCLVGYRDFYSIYIDNSVLTSDGRVWFFNGLPLKMHVSYFCWIFWSTT